MLSENCHNMVSITCGNLEKFSISFIISGDIRYTFRPYFRWRWSYMCSFPVYMYHIRIVDYDSVSVCIFFGRIPSISSLDISSTDSSLACCLSRHLGSTICRIQAVKRFMSPVLIYRVHVVCWSYFKEAYLAWRRAHPHENVWFPISTRNVLHESVKKFDLLGISF